MGRSFSFREGRGFSAYRISSGDSFSFESSRSPLSGATRNSLSERKIDYVFFDNNYDCERCFPNADMLFVSHRVRQRDLEGFFDWGSNERASNSEQKSRLDCIFKMPGIREKSL